MHRGLQGGVVAAVVAGVLLSAGCYDLGGPLLSDIPGITGANVIGLYLSETGLTLQAPPEGAASKRHVTNDSAGAGETVSGALPVVCFTSDHGCRSDWGTWTTTSNMSFMSDLAGTVWLSSPQAAIVNHLRFRLYRAGTDAPFATVYYGSNATTGDPDGSGQIGPTAKPFPFTGGPTTDNPQVLKFGPGEQIRIETIVYGVGVSTAVATSPIEIDVEFGSADRPSGFFLSQDETPPGVQPVGRALRLFLSDQALATLTPKDIIDKSRMAQNTGVSITSAPEWDWGSVAVGQPVTIVGDGLLTLYVALSGAAPAGALVELRAVAHVYAGPTALATSQLWFHSPVFAGLTGTTLKLVFLLDINAPVDVPAGEELKLALQIFGATDSTVGNQAVLFGGYLHPSAILLPVAFAGPDEAAPTPTAPTTGNATVQPTDDSTVPSTNSSTASSTTSTGGTSSSSSAPPSSLTNDTGPAHVEESAEATSTPGPGTAAVVAALFLVPVARRLRR